MCAQCAGIAGVAGDARRASRLDAEQWQAKRGGFLSEVLHTASSDHCSVTSTAPTCSVVGGLERRLHHCGHALLGAAVDAHDALAPVLWQDEVVVDVQHAPGLQGIRALRGGAHVQLKPGRRVQVAWRHITISLDWYDCRHHGAQPYCTMIPYPQACHVL